MWGRYVLERISRGYWSSPVHRLGMNKASIYCCVIRPPCRYRNDLDWPGFCLLSTQFWCLLHRRLDLSAPTPARSCWSVCRACLLGCCNFLCGPQDLTLKCFCDPFWRFCAETLHCCAVFLHFDLDVCKVMLQIFCGCFEPSLHKPH